MTVDQFIIRVMVPQCIVLVMSLIVMLAGHEIVAYFLSYLGIAILLGGNLCACTQSAAQTQEGPACAGPP